MQHKWVVIIVAVAIAGIAWYGLSQSAPLPDTASSLITTGDDSSGGVPVPGTTADATANNPGESLLDSLSSLSSITLDSSVFSDPAFVSLKDFSTPVEPEPVGRQDPFAALGASVAPTTQTTQGAQIFAPQH